MNWFKKLALWATVICVITVATAYTLHKNKFFGDTKEQAILQLMLQSLDHAHFKPQVIDDSFSKKLYKLYIKRLDYNKKFLLQSDIDQLSKYEVDLDNQAQTATFDFLDLSDKLYAMRVAEAEAYYKELLEKPFNYKIDESIETDFDKMTYAKSAADLKDEWRKWMKLQVLSRISDQLELQEKATEKKDTIVKVKSFNEIESDARTKVKKQFEDFFANIKKQDKNERMALYFNAFANVYDPHTEFFPPKQKQDFDMMMSGQLEGIGATLQEKDGFVRINSLVPGSPSYRNGKIKVGDLIIKVAQGSQEPVDVVGKKIDDVIKLIRGKKGTEVRLTLKKIDGAIETVSLIRDVIVFEDTYAKSAIINVDGATLGYIKLPSFYAPVDNKGRQSSIDVQLELEKLKAQKVQGIILDLRNNGGGSLKDVVDMSGYFIKQGPIVQVKSKETSPSILEDLDPNIVYDGPLAVMINSNSASASEILAAAMQDYKRAVIVGTNSFGKGTVQRFITLDDYLNPVYSSLKPLGSLKLTIQKFYRINGSTTQLKGVKPDITIPDLYEYLDKGEKEQDYPLSVDEISPLSFSAYEKPLPISTLRSKSEMRVKADGQLKLIDEEALRLKSQSDRSLYPLKLEKYRSMQKELKEQAKKFDVLEKEVTGLSVSNTADDAKLYAADTLKASRNKEWLKIVRRDYSLLEAARIVNDIK